MLDSGCYQDSTSTQPLHVFLKLGWQPLPRAHNQGLDRRRKMTVLNCIKESTAVRWAQISSFIMEPGTRHDFMTLHQHRRLHWVPAHVTWGRQRQSGVARGAWQWAPSRGLAARGDDRSCRVLRANTWDAEYDGLYDNVIVARPMSYLSVMTMSLCARIIFL